MPATFQAIRRAVLIGTALFTVVGRLRAQSAVNFSVQLSVVAQTNPPKITLSWPSDATATGYTVSRKLRDATSWTTLTASPLAGTATGYVDSNVANGSAYEYWVAKTWPAFGNGSGGYGYGYIYAGLQLAPVEFRGKVILIVDNRFTSCLSNELATLQLDLVGDGWTVLRHDVAAEAVDPASTDSTLWAVRSNELAGVKALITADYNSDPSNVNSVFLFGHVPVPYSGVIGPDDHSVHVGAWPADGFYGSTNADGAANQWTDFKQNVATASNPAGARNWNVPGDGKFDNGTLPSAEVLAVGRVDMTNLPSFTLSETNLLAQYLNKDHRFRQKVITALRQGLIDDNLDTGAFGLLGGTEPIAADAWRNFSAFFGASNIVSDSWLPTLNTQSYLWAYGCGGGTFTSCGGVVQTADLIDPSNDPQAVFTMMFGSYFGDWDEQDNLLRAVLAAPTYTLTSAWSGRPFRINHHMGLGETIGFSTLVTENNSFKGLYDDNGVNTAGRVEIALLGDPTLRMHIVAPPAALAVNTNSAGGLDLGWNPSPDAVLGYYVYRAPTSSGPFTRLAGSGLVTNTWCVDSSAASPTNTYMVRAVKLEVVNSGSYTNLSQGAFSTWNSGGLGHGDQIIANRSAYEGNGVILLVHTNGTGQSLGNTWLKDPYTVALDANGDILVACYQTKNGTDDGGVFKIDHTQPGNPPSLVSTNTSFVTPFGLAMEPNQNLLVADLDANGTGAVFRVNPFTGVTTTLATGGYFYWLAGIAVANNGGNESIFVADDGDGTAANPPKLISIDPASGAQTLVSSNGFLVTPCGLAVDPSGTTASSIIVANVTTTNGMLVAVTTNAVSGGWTQTVLTTNSPFVYPTHVAIDPQSGDYLVTDGNPVPLASTNNAGVGALYRVSRQTLGVTLLSTNGFFEQPRGIVIQP